MSTSPPYDIFVSYADDDRPWVEGYLINALTDARVKVHSESAFELGQPRLLAFEDAVTQSKRTVLVISPAYLAEGSARFVDLLAQTYSVMETQTWPVIPLILEPVPLPPRLAILHPLKATDAAERQLAVQRLAGDLGRVVPAATTPTCPYPGMRPFSDKDHRFFCGRENEAEALLRRLHLQRDRTERFTAVIGPSGSGKSSLVFAGLVPLLRRSNLFGAKDWTVLSLQPGSRPSCASTVVLSNSPTTGPLFCDLATERRFEPLLLIVDQFEQMFTSSAEEQRYFQEVLSRLAGIPNIFVVITASADFYRDLMASDLWRLISPNRVEVLPLGDAGLRKAIIRPAEQVSVYVEGELVERLVADAAGEPGVLPFLQQTLVLLWEHLERCVLPLESYETLVPPHAHFVSAEGKTPTGLQVVVAGHADATLADLNPELLDIARRIFIGLVQLNDGREDTRRQRTVDELRSVGDRVEDFDLVLQHLAANRLVTLSGTEQHGARRVDLAHEALITGWPWLQSLTSGHRHAAQTRHRLEAKVTDWERLGQGSGGLLDAVELAEAEQWLKSNDATVLGYGPGLAALVAASSQQLAATQELERDRTRAKGQVQAAAGALASGLGFGVAFGVAQLMEGRLDSWAAVLYGAAWIPLGMVFGLLVSIAMYLPRFRNAPALRVTAAMAAGGIVAGVNYVFARQWTSPRGTALEWDQFLAGGLTGSLLALGVAGSIPKRSTIRVEVIGHGRPIHLLMRLVAVAGLGVIGLAGAVRIEGLSWEWTTTVVSGLLLGGLTGTGFILAASKDHALSTQSSTSCGGNIGRRVIQWFLDHRPSTWVSKHKWRFALAGILLLSACGGKDTGRGADLIAREDEVYHQHSGGPIDLLAHEKSRELQPKDLIDVSDLGEGRVDFRDGFRVSIFRNSGLQIEGFADDTSPVDRIRLTGGTLFAEGSGEQLEAGRRLEITTAGAVITALGTGFLVNYNPNSPYGALIWVIVTEGEVAVTTSADSATVSAGWQIWVVNGITLTDAFPATRPIANWAYPGGLPLLEDLSGASLQDNAVLGSRQCTFGGTNTTFQAVVRTPDEAFVMNVDGLWVAKNQLDCPFAIGDLPSRAGAPNPSPFAPQPAIATAYPTTTPATPVAPLPDTEGPPSPVLIAPTNQVELDCNEPYSWILEWAPVSDASGIREYVWEVAHSESAGGPFTPLEQGHTSATSVSPGGLECDSWYWWNVHAIDGAGNPGSKSSPASFSIDEWDVE